MGKKNKRQFQWSRKRVIALIGVLLLIAALVAAGVLAWQYYKDDGGRRDEDGVLIDPIDEDAREIQDLYNQGDASQAREVAEEQLQNDNLSPEKELTLTKSLAGVELNEGNYQRAAEIIDAYPRDRFDHALASDGGIAYERLGNYDKAAEYYEFAIELWPRDDPLYESEVDYLREYIDNRLGKNS